MKNELIQLVSKTTSKDEYGVTKKTRETISDVIYAEVKSAGASEWFEGGRNGLNPQYAFIIRKIDYNGQLTVIYEDVRYAVYRTYIKGNQIELHTQREMGA